MPFGVGQVKPQHFRDMGKIVWENRDNLGYAWKVLSKGVCDGCALGVAGFRDWTVKGPHLCMTRLNLLRLNTMPELDHRLLADAAGMAMLDNQQLRKLGRLAYPMLRERGKKGFRRISWDGVVLDPNQLATSRRYKITFYRGVVGGCQPVEPICSVCVNPTWKQISTDCHQRRVYEWTAQLPTTCFSQTSGQHYWVEIAEEDETSARFGVPDFLWSSLSQQIGDVLAQTSFEMLCRDAARAAVRRANEDARMYFI